MSEFDRGAYTPQTDSPLSFDARVPRRGGGRPVPMTLIISADAAASHQSVVLVMEAARRAGLSHITFATQSAPTAGKR